MNSTEKKNKKTIKWIKLKPFGIAFTIVLALAAIILSIYFVVLKKPSSSLPPVIEISDGKHDLTLDGIGKNSDDLMRWMPFNETNVKSYEVIKQVMNAKKLKDFKKIKYIWDKCLNSSSKTNLNTIKTIRLKSKKKVVVYLCGRCVASDPYKSQTIVEFTRLELNPNQLIDELDPGSSAIMVYEE